MRTLDPQSLPQHVDRLYRAAWGMCGSREDAEDLVQETFARVLSRPRVLHGQDDLYYLMRVLRNTFLTGRRTAGRRPVTAATLEDVVTADPKPTSRPEHALEIQEVYGVIATLPEDFRMALVAVDVLGLSYREAARALRVREATITTRLFRARRLVVRELEGQQGTVAREPAAAGDSAAAPDAGSRVVGGGGAGPAGRQAGPAGRQAGPAGHQAGPAGRRAGPAGDGAGPGGGADPAGGGADPAGGGADEGRERLRPGGVFEGRRMP
jgi:RNA polymerase sigma-70 factor (ECF subfamily)